MKSIGMTYRNSTSSSHKSSTETYRRNPNGNPETHIQIAITRTNIGYDIVINEFATDGTHREYERRHHAWALTSHGADRAAQRLISRIKRQNQRDEHPREYTIE
jgi:hypothetical protein